MLEHVQDRLAKGLVESPLLPWQHSPDVAGVLDQALTQVGAVRAT